MTRSPHSLARLEIRLPLLISGLLVLVIGAFSWGAYREVRDVTLDAAGQHLERVTTQLVGSLKAGGPQRAAEVRQLATQPAVRAYLTRPGEAARDAARVTLLSLTARDSLNAAVELWNAAGERLLAVGRPMPPLGSPATQALTAAVTDTGAALGPLRRIGDSLVFPVITAVTVGGTPTAYVVNWRRVQASPEATQRFTALIGADASLLVGNVSGDVWTDLSVRVDGPPVDVRGRQGLIEYARPGRGTSLARAAMIGGTPWMLVVELPRDRVLAPVRSFVGRMAVVALALIAAGAIGAWAVSRQARRRLEAELAERRRAEDEVRAKEAHYRTILENIGDGVFITDRQGRYLDVNPRACEVTGYSRNELLGLNTADTYVPEERTGVPDRLAEIARSGSASYERSLLRKDGSVITVEVNAQALPAGNLLATVRDVTERKRLEEQLRQAQKMEAVGRLAGGVAHDFNNVLTAIFGYADLMAEEFSPGHPGLQDLEEIRKAASRASALTRQLLAFSRQQVLAPVVLSVNDLVEDVDKMLRRLLGEDVELRVALARDAGNVRADPGQIQQVIMNLVVNARDAMPTGGKLLIETADAELTEQYAELHQAVIPGPYVMIAVSDTGVGMDAQTKARIFEPFFTTKEKGKGTGLGLSTVYGIVKQSGGYVWVYSESGRGTTFKVYLPRVDAPAQPHAPPREAATLTGTETILLAEDDEILRPLTKGLLAKLGYTVLEAESAEQALAVAGARQGPIHLLMTDVVMPGASGRELARRLAQSRPETRVLYVSGYTDDAIVHHGMLEPGLNFLQKPFTPAGLARKVREVLDTT